MSNKSGSLHTTGTVSSGAIIKRANPETFKGEEEENALLHLHLTAQPTQLNPFSNSIFSPSSSSSPSFGFDARSAFVDGDPPRTVFLYFRLYFPPPPHLDSPPPTPQYSTVAV